MDILDDMGVSKLSAKVFLKVNHSCNTKALDLVLLKPDSCFSDSF